MPISGPPIRDGAVLIEPGGRLDAIGRDADVPAPDDVSTEAFPGAAIMPGLVNTHTHLELSGVGAPIHEASFFDWIQHIRRTKENASPEWFLESARRGVREAWRFGTTAVADTGDSGAVVAALSELGGVGVVFHEVFGPHPDQVETSMSGLVPELERLRAEAGSRVRVGVSPHAPYTVSEGLYRAVARHALDTGSAVALHLAESQAEVELVTSGRGAFADAWRARGIGPPAAARSPVDYARRTGILECRPLVIHAVQIDAADAQILADTGASVAICAGSNRAHGHGDPPVARLREAGIVFGVGTDSVASVPSLDLFSEARLAADLGGLSPEEALALVTLRGAAAIGLAQEIGSLDPGKWADLCLIELRSPADEEIAPALLGAGPGQILRTYVGGRCLYARPPSVAAE